MVSSQPEIDDPTFTGHQRAMQVQRGFAALLGRIDCIGLPIDQIPMKGIFDVGLGQRLIPKDVAVGFVFGEQPGPCLATAQFIGTHPTDRIAYQAVAIEMEMGAMAGAIPPRPGVAIPKGG